MLSIFAERKSASSASFAKLHKIKFKLKNPQEAGGVKMCAKEEVRRRCSPHGDDVDGQVNKPH